MHWTFAFYLAANANLRMCMISIYLANTQVIQIMKDRALLLFRGIFSGLTICLSLWIFIPNFLSLFDSGGRNSASGS